MFVVPRDLGSFRLERVALTGVLFALVHVFVFQIISRLGLVHARHIAAGAVAGVACWAFLRWVAPPATLAKPDGYGIAASLLVVAVVGAAVFAVTEPGYVMAASDPIIVPTLAHALLSHTTTMAVYQPGDPGFAYPPGYPILFAAISRLLTPLQAVLAFKAASIFLVWLCPVGWAWLAQRVFRVALPFWLILLLSYAAVFGLERTVALSLVVGKNAQILAGAVFPFLVGILLVGIRSNIGIAFAAAALVGGILLHYSMLYMVATFFVAYVAICFPRTREDFLALLRLALVGIVSVGVFVLLMRAALDDPRAGSLAWTDPLTGMRRIADVLLARHDELLFIFSGSNYAIYQSPYRGSCLLGCMLLPAALAWLPRAGARSFGVARMAGVFGIMWLIGIAFATRAVQVGIMPDFARWYLIFPQAAVILAALCALATFARAKLRGSALAYWGLGGAAVLASVLATSDFVWMAGLFQLARISQAELSNVRDALATAAPCFVITQSSSVVDGMFTVQAYRPLEYAEMLTGCTMLNGSFVQRGVAQGRAADGLPAPAALTSLPPGAAIFLVVPEEIEARYQDAVPDAAFVRQQMRIGPLPVWRIRVGP